MGIDLSNKKFFNAEDLINIVEEFIVNSNKSSLRNLLYGCEYAIRFDKEFLDISKEHKTERKTNGIR